MHVFVDAWVGVGTARVYVCMYVYMSTYEGFVSLYVFACIKALYDCM